MKGHQTRAHNGVHIAVSELASEWKAHAYLLVWIGGQVLDLRDPEFHLAYGVVGESRPAACKTRVTTP